jgi:lipoprotein-anchoring transpeptidase ErfK/SrfK
LTKQKLLNFLRKQAARALQNKTDLIIISVFLIMILFCVVNNAISQIDDLGAGNGQLEVAGIYDSSLAAVCKGSAEAYIYRPESFDIQGTASSEEIPEEYSKTDELAKEPGEEEEKYIVEGEDIIAEEDNVVDDISSDDSEDNPVVEEEQVIDFSKSDDFKIEVDLKKQKVFIYYKGEIIKEMICSAGAESSHTPKGEFTTTQKIEYDWVDRFDMGAYYWVRFFKSYLFHSIPFDKDGNIKVEELEKLGSPVSHGCVRLKLEDAKWLYEKLPLGVKVWIY